MPAASDLPLSRKNHSLGLLLMGLRDELLACIATGQEGRLLRVEPPQVPGFLLLGQPIAVIDSTGQQKPAARDEH
jgi:hypothetical protein